MPVVLPSSFPVGQTVKLWPQDAANEWCGVVAPDGREFKLKTVANGSVEIWLAQVGAWHYYWSAEDHGMLNVVPRVLEEPEIYEMIDGG